MEPNKDKPVGRTQLQWEPIPEPPEEAAALAESLSTALPFPRVLAEILARRGISRFEEARAFFKPSKSLLHDPYLMADMELAVRRFSRAREQREKVLVYGDYDVDGTTAVAMFTLFLEAWGLDFDYYIPDRYTEGYGLSYKGVEHASRIGASLLVCLDCGIKAHTRVKHAAQLGIDVIICDHHTPGASLPEAHAVLDPQRKDCGYPAKVLSGCGVGLKLCQALDAAWREAGAAPVEPLEDPFDAYCDLVTLSIASDIVPITGENRVIAWHGLQKLREQPARGIRAIMDLSEKERGWNISDLVFFVGPHINAAGRLNHAREAVEVLRGKAANLDGLARDLHAANTDRKDLDKLITDEALGLIGKDEAFGQRKTTVLYQPEWHKGVIGIVASRLIETHYRPTVLFTRSENKLVGSARSVAHFDLYEALSECDAYMLQFGGHAYAAGISLEEEQFQAFSEAFEKAVARRIRPEHQIPRLHIDGELRFSEIDARLIRLMNRMEPFGPGNRRPVFLAKDVEVTDARKLKDSHLRLRLRQDGRDFSAIGFNLYPRWEAVNALRIDLAFQPVINTWKGNQTIDLQLKDIRLTL